MTGAGEQRFVDWLAARLAAAGTRRAFGVPGGGGSLDLIAALRDAGIATQVTAREDAAVIMAGVSGLLSGGPGLAFTTKGPGLASAANGLASAALDRMPALLVSEGFEEDELNFLSHQVFDQAALVSPLLAAGGARLLGVEMKDIARWLASRDRPAVLLAAAAALCRATDSDYYQSPGRPIFPELDDAKALLGASRRPVIVAGLEAARGIAWERLREFAGKLGAPVLSTYMAKGCVPDRSPLYAGIFTGGAIEQPLVRQADLIVLVGLDPVELIRKPWAYDAPVLDICEDAHEPHYLVPEVRVTGRIVIALGGLVADVHPSEWRHEEIAGFRAGFENGMAAGGGEGLSSAKVVKAAAMAFDAEPRLAVDAGAHMFSACAFWPCEAPYDLLISNGLATMGFALPAALAAALHDPDRGAVAITGDGGLLMCLGELKTAVDANANVCIIVFNDGRLSLIDIKREERQFPDLGMSWKPPDFAAIARGFGLSAWRVDDESELDGALEAAAAETGPRLIDVRVDSSGYNAQIKALRG